MKITLAPPNVWQVKLSQDGGACANPAAVDADSLALELARAISL